MESQLRTEINQILQRLPEEQLKPILSYLQQIEKSTGDQVKTASLLKQIFEEDAELLKKLAQ